MNNFDLWGRLFKNISIRNKFYMSFFWIVINTAFAFIAFFYAINLNRTDTVNVEASARTRMLSQRLFTLSDIALNENSVISKQAKSLLSETVASMDLLYNSLENGGEVTMADYSTVFVTPVAEPRILSKISEIKPVFLEHKKLCETIINEPAYISIEKQGQPGNVSESSDEIPSFMNIQRVVNPKVRVANKKLQELAMENTLLKGNQQLSALYAKVSDKHINNLILFFSILCMISFTIIVFNFILIQYYVVNPINKISKAAEQIASGNINIFVSHKIKDGLGMIVNSINTLTGNLRKAAEFTVKIGQGHFDAKYDVVVAEGIDEKDNLAVALLNMRNRLKNVAEDDKKRNWATEGYAKFGEILRNHSDDLKKLSEDIIINLVKYLSANQGSLFIVNDSNSKDEFLELSACYAWDRKKHMHKKIAFGEGLAGQAWQEGESIYLTDIPDNFISITSGLGQANPNSLLIVPLKINDKIYGIIEIASFQPLEKNVIEFVEKLGESIASTISGVKINTRTKKLLEESQQQAEELQAQEEEVRQNMEEMTATQEELQRKEIESQKMLAMAKVQEEKLRKTMDEMAAVQEEILHYKEESEAQRKSIHSMAVISKTDNLGNIIYVNDEFLKFSKYSREEIVGKNHRILKSGNQPDDFYKQMWSNVSNGKLWRSEMKNKAKDGSYYWVDATISPIFDKNGKPKEYIAQGFVITDKKHKEELLLKELQELKRTNK